MEEKGSFSGSLPAFLAGATEGIRAAAREIMDEADYLCPKDTDTLVRSRFIDEPIVSGDRISISFGYGRGTTPNPKDGKVAGEYAVPVHEILGARHKPPTTAKFLETPCVAYEPALGETLRVWISRFVKGEGAVSGDKPSSLIASTQRLK
jgi:hypothetical protein